MLTIGVTLLIVALVVGLAAWSGPARGAIVPRALAMGSAVFGVLALIASGFTQIGAGQVGVSSLFGAVDKEPLAQGLHLINPLKSVTQMSTRTEAITVHAGPGGRKAADGESVDAISADGMRMPLDATVYYRLSSSDAP